GRLVAAGEHRRVRPEPVGDRVLPEAEEAARDALDLVPRHERAHAAPAYHQPGGGQSLEGLADGHAGDPVSRAELLLGEHARADYELAAGERLLDVALDLRV